MTSLLAVKHAISMHHTAPHRASAVVEIGLCDSDSVVGKDFSAVDGAVDGINQGKRAASQLPLQRKVVIRFDRTGSSDDSASDSEGKGSHSTGPHDGGSRHSNGSKKRKADDVVDFVAACGASTHSGHSVGDPISRNGPRMMLAQGS